MTHHHYHAIINTHLQAHSAAIAALESDSVKIGIIRRVAAEMSRCVNAGGVIYVAGNGGFGAVAQHLASELTGRYSRKRPPVAAVALNADGIAITCISNDYGFEHVFSRQLAAVRPGDMLIGMSVSGNSKNILEALYTAGDRGATTVAITGRGVAPKADIQLLLPGREAAIVQEVGMVVCHILCQCLESAIDTPPPSMFWDEVAAKGLSGAFDTLLLDRDGVINRLSPNGYVLTPEECVMDVDYLQAAAMLAGAYRHIFVVTNQKCVGKGLLSVVDLEAIHQKIEAETEAAGGRIDGIYCSTDADPDSTMSKPETGLADCMAIDFPDIDFSRAVMVGDSATDRLFAERIGAMFFKYTSRI